MPELPEVEVIRRGLQKKLPGHQVKRLEIKVPTILMPEPQLFHKILPDQRISEVKRRGKYLILKFETHHLLIHLRMTGQLTYWDASKPDSSGFYLQKETGLQRTRQHPVDKHTHFIIYWKNGNALYYRDIRKFGRIELLSQDELIKHPSLLSLGIEPFTKDYTFESFHKLFKSHRVIKALLLDQHAIAGLGNIYCDEALFLAGIHPGTPANNLSLEKQTLLFETIQTVLKKGIEFGGTSLKDYIDSDGKKGSNQEKLYVYGRKDKACRTCHSKINKITLVQRGTHFCPHCQK